MSQFFQSLLSPIAVLTIVINGIVVMQSDIQFNVPVVDFGKFWSGSKADRVEISRHVVKAFKEIGFMYISNHNIEQSVIDNTFKQVCGSNQGTMIVSLTSTQELRFLRAT